MSGRQDRGFGSDSDAQKRLRFQAQLLDSVRESVVATDLAGRVVYWGRGAERLYRLPAERAVGRKIESIVVTPDTEHRERERMRQVLGTGSWSGEYEQTRSDGTRFWAETFISLVTDGEERPIGYVGIDRDITDRRRVEDALRKSQDRLSLALDAAGAAFWDWDVASGEVYFSPQWKQSLGFAEDEVPARVEFWEHLVHPDDWPRVLEQLAAHFEGRTSFYECENRLRTASGEWRWNLDRGRVVECDADGRPLRMVGTDTDISSRKETERKLRETQKLESLGVLAGGIAHDFNNLLAVVLGNTEVLLSQLPRENGLHTHVREVEVAAKRAAELTRELLAYAGRSWPATEFLELSSVVEEMAQLLETAISQRAEMRLELANGLPSVEADPGQLRQIVMNLITNAAEAIDGADGRILLRTGSTRLGGPDLASLYAGEELDPGEYVFLEVEDSGRGMDDEIRARIFEPFFSTKFDGRGLGLAALLGIVRTHRGGLAVTSTPGVGSTFRVLLPPAPLASLQVGEPGDAATPWQGSGSVLVVDDEPGVRRVTRMQLERSGFSVQTARDGREAVERLQERPDEIDAVVLDLVMPGLGGRETLAELRRIRRDLPVILVSGYDAECEMADFAEHDPIAVLQKPFAMQALVGSLRELLDCRRGA